MRFTHSGLLVLAVALAWCASAQAIDTPPKPFPVPAPVGTAPAANQGELPPHLAPTTQSENQWRFKNYNGRWWYWLPEETWVYWQDGRWVHYDPSRFTPATTQPQLAASTPARGNSSYRVFSRGRGNNYYGNPANRPVMVPMLGYPGISPYVGRPRGFVPMMMN